MFRKLLSTGLLATATSLTVAQTPDPSTLPLVQPGQLVWDGGFRMPYPNTGNSDVGYGGNALAYSGNDQFYYVGHEGLVSPKTDPRNQAVGEFKIPSGISPNNTTLAALPKATQVQPFANMTHGLLLDAIGSSSSGGYRFGGMLVHGGRLILAEYNWYAFKGDITKSHWTHPLVTTDTNGTGPFRLGPYVPGLPLTAPDSLDPAFTGGYMAAVPSVWQSRLGGPALTGQCCTSIITRTSYGPSAFAFNPDNLGAVAEPVPTTPLLYYDENHQQPDGHYESDNTQFYNGSSRPAGMFIPEGTRSLLFIGKHGTGDYCYNNGTNSGPNNCLNTPPDPYCGQGPIHAWPYQVQVWAYDLNDLEAVKAGTKKPWEVRPYAIWPLTGNETQTKLPFFNPCMNVKGLMYDPATQRVWINSDKADGDKPVVHQFRVTIAAPPPPPPPPPPVTFTVTPSSLSVADTGETQNLTVDASDNSSAWTASSPASWIQLSPTSGNGDGTVTVTVSPNTSSTVRSETLSVAGEAIVVSQAGAPAPPTSNVWDLDYSTLVGGPQDDYPQNNASDSAGNHYLVGGTFGGFPGTSGCSGAQDGIIQKLSPTGQKIWVRCLGGSAKDYIHTIALDSTGVYVAGVTYSNNFPVTSGVVQPTFGGTKDNFVAKYDLNGTKLWATYLGGSLDEHDRPNIVVDANHSVWVAGSTMSTNFPLKAAGGYDRTHNGGGSDGYIVVLNSTGTTILHNTFIGGTGNDDLVAGIRLGSDGSVYAAGITTSADLPATSGVAGPKYLGGGIDGFIVKFDPTLTTRRFVTYVGGNGDDTVCENHGLTIDGSDKPHFMGQTTSTNLPTTAASFQRTLGGGIDVFLGRLTADGSTIETMSYLGGSDNDLASGIGVDGTGRVYVVGYTRSANFPLQAPFQATLKGSGTLDGTFSIFKPDLSGLEFSTFLGGDREDRIRSVSVSSAGRAFLAGDTNSTNFPLKNAAQSTLAGPDDYVMLSFSPGAPPPVPCNYTVSPLMASAAAGGDSLDFDVVTTATTCPWTASSPASWVTMAPTSGTGSGKVTATVAANVLPPGQPTGMARSTTITVAGRAIEIDQASPPPDLPPLVALVSNTLTSTYVVSVTDDVGVSQVRFLVGGVVVAPGTETAPDTYTATFQTPNGSVVEVEVIDSLGQVTKLRLN